MKILFRKNAPGLFSWAIRTLSRSIYSHVEIQPYGHKCVSSNEREGGVRWATISGNQEKWDVFYVKGFGEGQNPSIVSMACWHNYRDVVNWCENQVGKAYDWRGIIQYAFPHIRNKTGDLDKYYCSEFCQRALGQVHGELLKHPVKHPGGLYELLKELDLITPNPLPLRK